MSRLKKTSAVIEKALQRMAGIKSISPTENLGNGMTVAALQQEINDASNALEAYNTLLSKVDDALNRFEELENKLNDTTVRMLEAVSVKYGRDSTEYEMAGGTRLSERKKPKPQNGNNNAT